MGFITHTSNNGNLSESTTAGVTASEVHDAFDAAKEAKGRLRVLVQHGDEYAVEAIFETAHAFALADGIGDMVEELSNDLAAIVNGEA